MTEMNTTKQLAAWLAGIANEMRETDGDFIAQTAAYGLFLEQSHDHSLVYCDLIEAASNQDLISEARRDISRANLNEIFKAYSAQGKAPTLYFYEDFLRAYDPKAARGRGVHYSPPEVVAYMLGGIETILNEQFGTAADNTILLDPCCGIGTFLQGLNEATLPHQRAIGMELSKPASAIASRMLNNCEIHNVDSLQEIDLNIGDNPLAVVGNPPYSGHSANAGAIADLMADYRRGLDERNPKWLQDDYVKFIRMAQHRVDKAGRGIVAFITNHSYLFNPTFRAMRQSLMNSFDQVYVLDLHGNTKTNQESDNIDENIFPIQMGVSIAIMVKTSDANKCRVMHAGIRGTREHKLKTLLQTHFHSTQWEEVNPAKPFSIFIPVNQNLQREFYSFASLFDLFEKHSVGFVTSRDSFAVDIDREMLRHRIARLRDPNVSADEIASSYQVTDMNIEKTRKALIADPNWEDKIVEVLYRPFDKRWAYYSGLVMERPRLPFMENMMQDNLALAIGRAGQVTGSETWDVVFITDKPTDLNLFRRGGAMLFPLRAYLNGEKLNSSFQDSAEFLHYAYAILHSRIYRARYADFLKYDYPRIPIAQNRNLISLLSSLGNELVNVHLMRDLTAASRPSEELPLRIGGWEVPGKYLKDRKGRELSESELIYLVQIREAVAKTHSLQDRIDEAISIEAPWQ